ncbi:23S ribosomal RNA methyltransferase Erm [Salibacterium aidingense]|uniref:23S ribosomal RNA methyltransferase Erm n=1 Tax=Salibacterium aidingense TaxID=384933 RepID=UPI003BC02CAE
MRKQNKRHRKARKCVEGPNFSGQHLLHHRKTIHDIMKRADLKTDDLVLDIGAGKGALTFPAAERSGRVLAVEYDGRFVEALRRKAAGYSNISIYRQDFLKFFLPKQSFSVVASIPYAITTPIMNKLLWNPGLSCQKGVIVMEKGAAKRFTAASISDPRVLKWRMWFELSFVKKVSREHFGPPPNVDSAILAIRRREQCGIPMKSHKAFSGLAEYALKHPRWPVGAALKGVFTPPQLKHLVKALGIDQQTEICLLSETQWETVCHTMIQHVDPSRWPRAKR